jgi:UDP-galactopyranose mutase
MILIVGCGLSGAVIAQKLAPYHKILIIDKRNHIGGNCYDYIDTETNIRINKYGAHIFHTNSEKVWNYIQNFSKWKRWDHYVLSDVDNKFINIPVNLNTINKLFDINLQNEKEMKNWLPIIKTDIRNSEDVCLNKFGKLIYDKLFKYYTYKQWNKYPSELEPEVLERIPIRYNNDNRYFHDKYQALPEEGYTKFIENMLNHENITIKLNTNVNDVIMNEFETIIYTGKIDDYISLDEKLEYRSINFTKKIFKNTHFYQPNSVINYPQNNTPYTRSVEYKHFLNQKSNDTVVIFEETVDEGEPYYPVPTKKNKEIYEKYKLKALELKNVHFIGRLGEYKYMNMDEAILNSLIFSENYLDNAK